MSNNIPSLVSVMTTAGQEIVNRANHRTASGDVRPGNWPSIRTARMDTSVSRGGIKYAQFSGGGGLNNTTTQPSFYSPYLTPTSYQVPNTRKEIYLWANFWRNNEPKVAAGINFYTNFPFNGWKLECKSATIKDFYEKLMEKLNFQKYLPLVSSSYHLYGDSFVLASIDCPICEGTMINPRTGEECEHEGASWKSLTMLNPDSVNVVGGFMDSPPIYTYLPNDREIKVVMERQPIELFNSIPDEVKSLIITKQPIKFSPTCIHHFKHGADYWADYGTSLLRPLFVTLAYKDKLRQAQWLVAERHILPVRIVTVGDDKRPASQEDLDSVQDQLSAVANDPNLTLVVPHAFDYKFVGANGQVLQITNELELLDQEVLDGLMLNKALLNGEGPAYGNAQVGLQSMNDRLESWRREVAWWVENKIFKPVAEWNNFYATGEGGQKELIYPRIKFDDLKLKDNGQIIQNMVTAQQNGVISAQTLVEQMGLPWDQEVERLRFEQGMNFVNSADVMNTDMNIGFGGVSGQGFGGGLNQPLTPGGGGAPAGGAGAPMPPPGGEAPAGGAGAPPAGPTADVLYKQYRVAAETMNEIFFNRTAMNEVNEQVFLNEIDRELNERRAVTGRAHVGEIPEILDAVNAWDHYPAGKPMNYQAVKDCRFAKVKEKQVIHGYTGLEKKLYQIVMGMQVPLAFYAQYEAGPSKEYILDGAFPHIRLGVEADGEIWHNNDDKISQDKNRDTRLAQQGWTILRFTDREIEKQPRDVAMVIQQAVQKLLGAYQGGQGGPVI